MSIQFNPSSVKSYSHGGINYRLTLPAHLQAGAAPALSSKSTLRSSTPQAQCCNSLSDFFKGVWKKLRSFFRWCLNCCGLCQDSAPSLPPSKRKNRLSKADAAIQQSLNAQMQRNAEQ